ncbi:MAG: deoxyribose-phosphate aldolase [Oscillospiraceae bacterium]|nr:deoxyribose-phosphate aldolase [Oscillospiraceae bacterium]
MTDEQIYSYVDHTLLSATATSADIEKLCKEAVKYKTASVCIPPTYIKLARSLYPDLNICTVVGFPLGYDLTSVKALAAKTAVDDSANEIDMVVNITHIKNNYIDAITDEVAYLKQIAQKKVLKVIIETCYLNDEEKIQLCEIVTKAGADYIKTSTGFGTSGAVLSDIELFKKHIGYGVKIKAAGGIRTREDMVAFINAGADRLGTSSAVKILSGGAAGAY